MRRLFLGVALLIAAGGFASACTSPRDVLGPKESSCYRAIAVARLAVRGSGQFSGVRELASEPLIDALERGRLGPADLPPKLSHSAASLCLVAYRGTFSARTVASAWPLDAAPDHYAVVVVREADAKVLTTILLRHEPVRLTRVFPPLL